MCACFRYRFVDLLDTKFLRKYQKLVFKMLTFLTSWFRFISIASGLHLAYHVNFYVLVLSSIFSSCTIIVLLRIQPHKPLSVLTNLSACNLCIHPILRIRLMHATPKHAVFFFFFMCVSFMRLTRECATPRLSVLLLLFVCFFP